MPKPVQIAIIVLCLGAAGYFILNFVTAPGATANEGVMQAYHFKCMNRDCQHAWSWQRGEDIGGRETVDTCPECATIDAAPAAKCQECGHYQAMRGHGTYDKICPECNAELPSIYEQE